MGTAVSYSGGCFCGVVRYQVSGSATELCFCHCTSCRRASGAALVAWGTFSAERFVVTGGNLLEVVSSPGVKRGHCAACGTSITYRHEKRRGEIDVTLSTFDDAASLRPDAHIWVQDKLPWVHISDGLPQYEAERIDA
jgi:hypothetical protein